MPASKKVKYSLPKDNKNKQEVPNEAKQQQKVVVGGGGRRSRSLSSGKRATSDEQEDNKANNEQQEMIGKRSSSSKRNNNRAEAVSSSTFKTPANRPMPGMNYAVITPKMQPNTPMTILRRPRDGETALSMQGSPLLISAVVEEKTANLNVPLKNGDIMSMLPKEGFRKSQMPKLEQSVKEQLALIKKNIDMVLND